MELNHLDQFTLNNIKDDFLVSECNLISMIRAGVPSHVDQASTVCDIKRKFI